MSIIKTCITAAALAASTAAFASPGAMSDAQYLAAARCSALIASPALGGGASPSLEALLRAEGRGRLPEVADRADEVRQDAMRQAGHAGTQGRAGLIAERDGPCRSFGQSSGGATAMRSQPNTNN